jgi:hypothetical protein
MPIRIPRGESQDFWSKYAGPINELQGNVSDITRYDNYEKAVNELKQYKQQFDDLNRVGTLRQKLAQTTGAELPEFREEDISVPNVDYFDMLPEEQIPQELRDYTDYMDRYTDPKTKEYTKEVTFDDYLTTLGKKEEFLKNYPNAFKTGKKQVPMTKEELEQARYKMAGFTDEDTEFFTQNAGKEGEVADFNKILENLALKYGPMLRSSGSMGNQYEEQFGKELQSMLLQEPEKTKFETYVDKESGEVVYFDPYNPLNVHSVKYANKEKPPTTKNWKVFEDSEGNPYHGEWVYQNGEWVIEKKAELNKKEMEDYSSYKDKRDKTGVYTPTGRRGYTGSSKNTDFSKWTPEKLKSLSKEDLLKFTAGELKGISDYRSYLDEEVSDELADLIANAPSELDELITETSVGSGIDEETYKNLGDDQKFMVDELGKFYGEFNNALSQMQRQKSEDAKLNAMSVLEGVYTWMGSLEGHIPGDVLEDAYKRVDEFVSKINWPY